MLGRATFDCANSPSRTLGLIAHSCVLLTCFSIRAPLASALLSTLTASTSFVIAPTGTSVPAAKRAAQAGSLHTRFLQSPSYRSPRRHAVSERATVLLADSAEGQSKGERALRQSGSPRVHPQIGQQKHGLKRGRADAFSASRTHDEHTFLSSESALHGWRGACAERSVVLST